MASHSLHCRQAACRLASFLTLTLCVATSADADTTTLTVANASKGTSSTPVLMQFPITRSGDLGYETALNYHTVDGTAHAGTDYSAASGMVLIAANSSGAPIPVTLSAQTGAGGRRSHST